MAMLRLWALAILAFFLAIAGIMPEIYAAGCGTTPASISVVACVPMNVINSEAIVTPSGMNLLIPVNAPAYSTYEASNMMNVFIYNSISGVALPAWLEGNVANENIGEGLSSNTLTYWVKLDAPIGASATALDVYQIGFASTSTNLYTVATANVGVAPQLYCSTGACPTSRYAGADNGNQVFPFYDNFSGSSLRSKWATTSTPPTYSVSNGLTITGTPNSGDGIYSTTTNIYGGNTMTLYGTQYGTSASCGSYCIVSGLSTTAYGAANNQGLIMEVTSLSSGADVLQRPGNQRSTAIPGTPIDANEIYQVDAVSAFTVNGLINYGGVTSAEGGTGATFPYNVVFSGFGSTFGTPSYIQWVRVTVDPPGSIMPTVNFGALFSNGPSITFSPSSSVTYGTGSLSVTATCTPSSDSCAVDPSPATGTHLCIGTGSCTYNIPNYAAAGTLSYSANDLTNHLTAIGMLTVNKASPTSRGCNYLGQSETVNAVLSNGQTYATLNDSGILSCNIASLYNEVTASLVYNGINAGTGYAIGYNTVFNGARNPYTWNSPATANYLASTWTGNILYIDDQIVSVTQIPSIQYETATQSLLYVLNITKAATTANLLIDINNSGGYVAQLWDNQTVLPTKQDFLLSYPVNLLTTNNIVFNYNAVLYLDLPPIANLGVINTMMQNVLFNYIPLETLKTPYYPSGNSILGDNIQTNTVINQVESLNIANVLGNIQIGNTLLTESILGPYNYYRTIASFQPMTYNLIQPTLGSPTLNIAANSIVHLCVGSSCVWRNQTATFNSFFPTLISCGSPTAINWEFYNASNPQQGWPGNIMAEASFNVENNGYQGPIIPGTTVAFPATATSNTYSTCISPSWSMFGINGTIQYAGTGAYSTPTYQYLLNRLGISATPTNVVMYLQGQPNPILYQIRVYNNTRNNYQSALVQELLFNLNTANGILINVLNSSASLGAFTTLNYNSTYLFRVLGNNGNIIAQTARTTAVPCSTSACLLTIYIGSSNFTLPATNLTDIRQACVQTALSGNTEQVVCTTSTRSGDTYPFNLTVFTQGALLTTNVCSDAQIMSSGSVSCTVGSTNTIAYQWTFKVATQSGTVLLSAGQFGNAIKTFGPDAAYIVLLIMVATFLLFITKNPNLSVIAFVAAFILGGLAQLIYVPVAVYGFLILMAAIILYVINRGGG